MAAKRIKKESLKEEGLTLKSDMKPQVNLSFVQDVRAKMDRWSGAWKVNNDQYNEFMSFIMGNQWNDDEVKVFDSYKKIPMTFNKLSPLMNMLLGEQRQNTPQLQVTPEDDVPEPTVQVREALVKDISLDSKAKVVYQNAFQQAAIGGFGAYYLGTEYENNMSLDLKIVIKDVKDPTVCYWDLSAQSPCKTDGMHAGTKSRISRLKFAALYGEDIEKSVQNIATENSSILADDDSIVIINHYQREYYPMDIYKLSNGKVVNEKQLKALPKYEDELFGISEEFAGRQMYLFEEMPVHIVAERRVPRYKIKHYIIGGDYILEETDFPSEQLPLIFLDQNSYWDKTGKQMCRPLFKDAKDAQRFLNYIGTQIAYLLKVSRYDQFMGSKENVRGADTQQIWRDPANFQGMLVYDESPSGAKPEQIRAPEISQSLQVQYERALQDIQTSTGIYNAHIGREGNEVSGRAIDARTKQGSYATFVPFDSLNRSIAVAGEIINEMIPMVYDSERTLMLNMPERGMTPIKINAQMDEYGGQMQHDMTEGRFTIRLLPGPSYEGQKEEALQSMQMVLQHNPQMFQLIADLYVENLPLPNNIELRNRLRTIVPPEIIEAGKTGQPMPPKQQQQNPEAQAKMMEIHLKQQALQQKQQESATKAQLEQAKLQLEWEKMEHEKMEMASNLTEQQLRYKAETHRTNSDANIAHSQNLVNILLKQADLRHQTQQ